MSRAQLTSTVEQSSAGVLSPRIAGKNKIINGDFGIWQRGTSFTNPSDLSYTADRFLVNYNGTGATRTISQQTFTPGTAPVAGYEGQFFYRYAVSVAGSGNTYNFLVQRIEDVRQLAGQTVTVSFWGKADSSRSINGSVWRQNFGSGGSGDVDTNSGSTFSFTTSWQRFTTTFAVPSIAGKTIGTSSYVNLFIASLPSNTTFTVDIWGVQLEVGSVATPFTTATGTVQGELAACQRYFVRFNPTFISDAPFGTGIFKTTTAAAHIMNLPVTMRSAPSTTFSAANTFYCWGGAGSGSPSAVTGGGNTTNIIELSATRSSTTVGFASYIQALGAAAAYVDASAEL